MALNELKGMEFYFIVIRPEPESSLCWRKYVIWLLRTVCVVFVYISDFYPLIYIYQFSADPGTNDIEQVLKSIYVAYSDCALKDPFYELDM